MTYKSHSVDLKITNDCLWYLINLTEYCMQIWRALTIQRFKHKVSMTFQAYKSDVVSRTNIDDLNKEEKL